MMKGGMRRGEFSTITLYEYKGFPQSRRWRDGGGGGSAIMYFKWKHRFYFHFKSITNIWLPF